MVKKDSTSAMIPLPMLEIGKNGKVVSANEHIGEVFLYEGIEGGDIFALTGIKAAELFAAADNDAHPLVERNDKVFRILAYRNEADKDRLALIFTDITVLEDLKDRYNKEKPCVAKVEIDNYDELIERKITGSEVDLTNTIDRIIRSWSDSMKGSLGRIKSNKYMIWFTQGEAEKEKFLKFDILDEIRNLETDADFPASLSIGIGIGGKTLRETEEYADAALDLALGRGGDQAVVRRISRIDYYGGKLQTVEKSNKGKSRIVGHALQQLIMQSKKIFIMGHKSTDVDAFGAALGITRLCMENDKEPYIVIEEPNESLEIMLEQAKGKEIYKFIACEKAIELCDRNSLVIVVDTHRPDLVQCPELLDMTNRIVVIDHHRKMENAIDNPMLNYMEAYASSTCELVTEILQYMLKKKVMEKLEAEALLAGITVDTNNFSIKAGVRTFEAAAWLRRQGADPTEVKRFFQEDIDNLILKSRALAFAEILGCGIAITHFQEMRSDSQLMCAQIANTLLTVKGVKASFAIGRDEDRRTVVSARSLGDINVQVIMEKMGGGGHLTTAAAQVNLSIAEVIKMIVEETEEILKK